MAFIVHALPGRQLPTLCRLGGIAIAIGAMVDAAVVMIGNAAQDIETWKGSNPGVKPLQGEAHWTGDRQAAVEVGPGAVFSPADHQPCPSSRSSPWRPRRRLFVAPLAFTKTYAMAAAAGYLSVNLGYAGADGLLDSGHIPQRTTEPLGIVWLIGALPACWSGAGLA